MFRLYLYSLLLLSPFCSGSSSRPLHPWLHHHKNFLMVLCLLFLPPPIWDRRTPSLNHNSGHPGLMRGKLKNSACIHGPQQLGNEPASPILLSTSVLLHKPSHPPTHPHPCPCIQPFPLLHFVWLLTKAQVIYISSRKIALDTSGEHVALAQTAHLVISNVPPCDLFYNIYCFYCYSNINWLICLFN